MKDFSKLVTNIVSDLYQGGFIKDANELQHFANLILDQNLSLDIRKDALKQIEMRCHVKWLGDFHLPHLSQQDWWGKLEKLGRSIPSIDESAMKALKIACDKFAADGKDISEFNITLFEEKDKNKNEPDKLFVVTFMGRLSRGKRGLGTTNRTPGSVTYFISRKEWEIVKEQGIK